MPPERPLADLVDAEVPRDRVEPRREARLVLEVGGVLHHADERVLHDLLRGRLVSQMPQREIEEGPLVLAHEKSEGRPVPALEPDHERFVGRFGA